MNPNPEAPVQQPSWFRRNMMWVIPVGCLVPLVCCGAFGAFTYFGTTTFIQASPGFATALGRAAANRDVQDALGAPIKPRLGITGSASTSNGRSTLDFSAPIEGPKGKGTLRAVGSERNGTWDYSVLEVVTGSKTINLLEDSGEAEEDLPPPDDREEPEPEDPDGD